MRNKFILLFMLILLLLAACSEEQTTAAGKATSSQSSYRWKMVTTWPPNFPVFQEGVERFANDVRTMSQGRLDIQVFAGGELVPPLQVFDAVSQGTTVQIGHGAAYYWAGKIPAGQFFTSVPFGMNAQGMNTWLYSGGGLELWQKVYAPHNLVPFPMGNSGVQMGGWFNKKITSVDDLQGLKMRLPGLGGKVLAKAGGNPVLLAGGEIYTALERNTIDATEWVGPYHDLRLGLERAAKYYYYPGWHEPGSALELIINQQAWASLPPELQKMVEVAAQATSLWMFTEFENRNMEALQSVREQGRIEILEFPSEVTAELKRLTEQSLQEQAASDPQFRQIYDAYNAFRLKNKAWFEISEAAYQRASH